MKLFLWATVLSASSISFALSTPEAAAHVINTRVAILGGGMAGIIAARTLNQEGIDFILVEARNELGESSSCCCVSLIALT